MKDSSRIEKLERMLRPEEAKGKTLLVFILGQEVPGDIAEGDSIGVVSEQSKALTERLIAGERTGPSEKILEFTLKFDKANDHEGAP